MPEECAVDKVLCGSGLMVTGGTIDWAISDFSWYVSYTGEQKSPKAYFDLPSDDDGWWLILKTGPASTSDGKRVRVQLSRQRGREFESHGSRTPRPDGTYGTIAIRWGLSILDSTGKEIYSQGSTFKEKNFIAEEAAWSSDASCSICVELPWERFFKPYDDNGELKPKFVGDDDTLNIRMRFQYVRFEVVGHSTVSVRQIPCLTRAQEKWLDLSDLLESKKGSDFLLAVESGKEYKVHRNILQERSEYFAGMLNSNVVEQQSGRCLLPDVDEKTLEVLLQFVYGGLKAVPDDLVEPVFIAADRFLFPSLKDHCEILLIVNLILTNVKHYLALSEKYSAEKLRAACTKVIEDVERRGFLV